MFAAMLIAVLSAPLYAENNTNDTLTSSEEPCRWWQRHCQQLVQGFPEGAPTTGVVVTIDTTHNIAYLWRDAELIAQGPAATGMDKMMRRGLRAWLFRTPRGRHTILRKAVNPIWTKPDWAFIEEGKPIPPPGSPQRQVRGVLGKYALHLGGGIFIHGTKDLASLGKKASHGCIRLGPEMLELVYQHADIGTEVHIF
jgi:L,D-transpeptidase ErfK/SrfK